MILLNNLLIMFVLMISSSHDMNKQVEPSSKTVQIEAIGKQLAVSKAFKALKKEISE